METLRETRRALLALAVALLGIATPQGVAASLATLPNAAPAGHLYVAWFGCGELGPPCISRYPIVRGVPVFIPDRVYANAGSPAAVAADGTLYATQLGSQIEVFAPGSGVPTRVVPIPPIDGVTTFPTALSVGPDGDLYVGYAQDFSGTARRTAQRRIEQGCRGRRSCIAVYHRQAVPPRPFMRYNVPIDDLDGPTALAFDASNLIVATSNGYGGFLFTVTQPDSTPTVAGRLDLPGRSLAWALSISDGQWYAATADPGFIPETSTVLVYPSGARNHEPPSRTIDLPNSSWGIAIAGAYGYAVGGAPDGLLSEVRQFPKDASGDAPVVRQRLVSIRGLPETIFAGP